jgi:hypothetical protein
MGNDQPALHALFACESGLSENRACVRVLLIAMAKEAP